MTEKKKRVIFYGTVNEPVLELLDEEVTQELADDIAYQSAMDDYEQYEDMYDVIRSVDFIKEEEDVEEYEAYEIYRDEREPWLTYGSEEYDPEKHDPDLEF